MRSVILALLFCLPASGTLGIALIASNPTAGGTTISATTSGGCAAGSSVLAFVTLGVASGTPALTASDSRSNTWSGIGSIYQTVNGDWMQFLSADNIATPLQSGDTITVVSTISEHFGFYQVAAFCVTGAASSPRDLTGAVHQSGGFNPNVVSGVFTTNSATPNEIVLMGAELNSPDAIATPGAGYTAIFSNSSYSITVEYQIISAQLAAATATETLGGSHNWDTTVISLVQAAAGASTRHGKKPIL